MDWWWRLTWVCMKCVSLQSLSCCSRSALSALQGAFSRAKEWPRPKINSQWNRVTCLCVCRNNFGQDLSLFLKVSVRVQVCETTHTRSQDDAYQIVILWHRFSRKQSRLIIIIFFFFYLGGKKKLTKWATRFWPIMSNMQIINMTTAGRF